MADLRTRYLAWSCAARWSPHPRRSPAAWTACGGWSRPGPGRWCWPRCSRRSWPRRHSRSARCWHRCDRRRGAAGYPEQVGYGAGPAAYLALIEQAKASLSIPVVASLNGVSRSGWVRYASRMEQAGADALELNVYYVSSRPGRSGSEVEWRTWTWSGRCARRSGSRWRSSSAPISARWPTWPGSWPRPAPTGWCCSTASASPT
jgi:hypothetical protein